MKASKFSDAQKAYVLRQGEEGVPVAEICRKAGMSQATYFNWKKKFGGMLPSEVKKLRALEEENRNLNDWWPTSPWIRPCFRMSSNESSKA